jgi:hypothetical protein
MTHGMAAIPRACRRELIRSPPRPLRDCDERKCGVAGKMGDTLLSRYALRRTHMQAASGEVPLTPFQELNSTFAGDFSFFRDLKSEY